MEGEAQVDHFLRLSTADVPQPRLGEICTRKVSFWRRIVLRHLAALRPSTASDMTAAPLSRATTQSNRHLQARKALKN
eukprot:2345943-Prymnesium_polylepis.1